MNRLGKGLVASLVISLIAFGLNPAVAVIDEMLSLSLGADRPLEFMGVSDVKLSRDGRRVAAVTRDEVCVWDGDSGRRLLQVENDMGDHIGEHWLLNVDIDDAGRRVVTGGQFNRGWTPGMFRSQPVLEGSLAKLWDAESGRLVRTFVLHEQRRFRQAAISRNGSYVACVDTELDVKLWDAKTGRLLVSMDAGLRPNSAAHIFAFSDDAMRFAALGGRPIIYLCDLTTRRTRTIAPLPGEDSIGLVAISGDGREVVAWLGGVPGRELAIFDFETGLLRDRLPGPRRVFESESISYLAFSPDGKTIALGKDDGRLTLIRRSNGVRVELRVSDGPVRAVAFLPNRVRIVAERKFIVNADRGSGEFAGPMRIADFAVLWPML